MPSPGSSSLRHFRLSARRPALQKRVPSGAPPRTTRTTGYATLAAPSLVRPQLAIHPSFFLIHLGGISLASCLIPVIGAKRGVSTQATTAAEEHAESAQQEEPTLNPPFPFIYPVQQPFPPLHQRRRLALQLRHQLETAPLDAAFNLRQLRLVTEEPRIHLPPEPETTATTTMAKDPYTDLSNLRPVPWVWRFPATVALHSILRFLRQQLRSEPSPSPSSPSSASSSFTDPHPPRAREALLPLAITIAQHSLRFDALMWNATLRGQKQQGLLEWDRLVADERRRTSDRPEAKEKVRVVTRLASTSTSTKRPRERTRDPKLEVWEQRHRELAEVAWTGRGGRKQRRTGSATVQTRGREEAEPAPVERRLSRLIRPALSIPTSSLDALFLHLVEVEIGRFPSPSPSAVAAPDDPSSSASPPNHAAAALELAASLSRLRRHRSRRAIYHSFQLAISLERYDLASDFWSDLLQQVRRSASSTHGPDQPGLRWLDKLFGRLVRRLRTEERSFAAAPSKMVLAAVATLTRSLDEVWTTEMRREFAPVVGLLIRTLATFPPAPFAGDLEPGSGLRRQARTHRKVFEMVQLVMRRILEDNTRRDIHLGPVKSRLGLARPDKAVPLLATSGLVTADFNTLVSYSLLKLQSPELAMLLLERMDEQGLKPTAATQNIVFSAMGGGTDLDTLERLLATRRTDPRAVPVFLKHLAETASFEHLEAITFRLLPELHYEVDELGGGLSYGPSSCSTAALPPVRPPSTTDLASRTPFLYTTLLYALSCAGRVGLAERVFRNARWAAELSRASSDGDRNSRGWVLPPQAFTIMLQMYAGEVRRGRQLEKRDARARMAAREEGKPVEEQPSTPFVRGWGRHALRVFLLQEQRSRLQSELGEAALSSLPRSVSGLASPSFAEPGSSSSPLSAASSPPTSASPPAPTRTRRLLDLPPFLRSEAAPIAAMWELEGGSKEPELANLERALKSPQAADALRILFRTDGTHYERLRDQPAQETLLALRKASWRKGYRAGQDTAKERIRRRSEALRRHALVQEMSTEATGSSTTSTSEPLIHSLKTLLAAAPGAKQWSKDDVNLVVQGLTGSSEQHALSLAVLARTLRSAGSPTSTASAATLIKDELRNLLAGTDTNELIAAFRLLSALFQVAPETATLFVKDPTVASNLQEAIESVSATASTSALGRASTKGKEKQDQAVVELVELLSLAAGQPTVRLIVDDAASPWLERLLGTVNKPVPDRRLAALAGAATIKIRMGREAAATTGVPSPEKPKSDWSSVTLAHRLVELSTPSSGAGTDSTVSEDATLLPVLEGLAFLTLTPSPQIKRIASDEAFLARLFGLADSTERERKAASTSSSTARDYALATLLDHLTAYPPSQSASDEAKQVERLKRFASAAGREDDELEYETSEAVEERVLRIVRIKPSPVPLLRQLCTSPSLQTRRAVGRILHSFVTPQKTRGELLQAGVARLLLSLVRHLPTPFQPAEDIPPVQGLAKLLITANPLLVFGPTADSPLLLEAMSALTLPLGTASDGDEAVVGLLPRFECLMALTNVASVGPSLADALARAKLRDRPETLVLSAIEDSLLSQNTMVRRAATELVCNLAASDAGIEHFEPPASPIATASATASDTPSPASDKPPSQRLHILLALTSSPDLPTRQAATGALTSLVYSPRTAAAMCLFAPWRKMLLASLGDDDPGVRHRVYEVWRVIGEVVAGSEDQAERERGRKAVREEEPRTVLKEVVEAVKKEKVDQLKEVVQAAVEPRYTLSAATQLPTSSFSDTRVTRRGNELVLGNSTFHAVGSNIYWLGLDENVDPSPSYPSKSRVLEAFAIAAAMGATTVRSQSLGISYGTGKSIENALNTFKPEGDPAWDALDFAVFAARQYGIRLVLPLTDQYDYYHGGIPTFLRWRNLSATNYAPFYDLSSAVYADFEFYIGTLLNHTSPYTNLTLASDPTVLAFETGNELGGWTGKHYAPPVIWTRSVARLIKSLSPDALVISGSYGVRKDELAISEIDIVSDHYYPLSNRRLSRAASLAPLARSSSSIKSKAFLVGEYDWTNKAYLSWRFAWFILLLPLVIAFLLVWATPKRWWLIQTTWRRLLTCGACRCGRRRGSRGPRPSRGFTDIANAGEFPSSSTFTLQRQDTTGDGGKSIGSTDRLPILGQGPRPVEYPPIQANETKLDQHAATTGRLLDRPLTVKRWHIFPLPCIILLPILIPILVIYLPSPINSFLSHLQNDSRASETATGAIPRVAGDLWWSLFGRNDLCDAYVTHNDGYTLHYPAFPISNATDQPASSFVSDGSGRSVLELTKHAWTVRGETPFWLEGTSAGAAELTWETLPAISCRQESLRWPNGTIIV
ncbi:hypothetical protein JCM10908_003720 [Rhodotorula pacifica]|uniref:uncharacterized protein n=1 Tax=Rhodotorula pacifica TaxID=1495444 RepID=UPI00317B02EB